MQVEMNDSITISLIKYQSEKEIKNIVHGYTDCTIIHDKITW